MYSIKYALVFILIILIIGSLSASSTIPIIYKKATAQPIKKAFTDSDFDTLYSSPDSYVGSNVNITGKIFNFPPSGITSLRALQMQQGGNIHANVIVFYRDNGMKLTENDCIRVIGSSAKQQEYTNVFRAALTAVTINAKSIEKVNCISVINPAKKTVFVEETQEQGGIHVYLYKVEFSDKNTRVYAIIANKKTNSEDLHFYDFNAKAIQGSHQFGTTYSFDVEYPKIKSDISPGIEENGVILFEPLDYTQSQASLVLPISVGFTKEYKFTFDINLSNDNANKHPQFQTYENFDYKIKVACPTSWTKSVKINTFNFVLSCYAPDNNVTKAAIIAQSTTYMNTSMNTQAQKQYLSSILSDIKNNRQARIINSSYIAMSNNSALQVLSSSNNVKNQTKSLQRYTITENHYYRIWYTANHTYFDKYLPIAQKVIDSLQIKDNPLPSFLTFDNTNYKMKIDYPAYGWIKLQTHLPQHMIVFFYPDIYKGEKIQLNQTIGLSILVYPNHPETLDQYISSAFSNNDVFSYPSSPTKTTLGNNAIPAYSDHVPCSSHLDKSNILDTLSCMDTITKNGNDIYIIRIHSNLLDPVYDAIMQKMIDSFQIVQLPANKTSLPAKNPQVHEQSGLRPQLSQTPGLPQIPPELAPLFP